MPPERESLTRLRERKIRSDSHLRTVDGQRRFAIVPENGTDPLQVFHSAGGGMNGHIVVTRGDLVLVSGPLEVRAGYLAGMIEPESVALRCTTCKWQGKWRGWQYRRLLTGDAMRHRCTDRQGD